MGGQITVAFNDIYMVKMNNDVAIPSKCIFYHKFLDGTYSKRKLGECFVWLIKILSSKHFTIKLSSSKF